MQQLLGEKAATTDGSRLKELFLQPNVHMVLTSTGDSTSLDDLAQLADKITEVAVPSGSAVSTNNFSAELERLHTEMASLKGLVQSFATKKQDHRRSHHQRSRPNSPHPTTEPHLCWYHHRFGASAHKCTSPCSWEENEKARH